MASVQAQAVRTEQKPIQEGCARVGSSHSLREGPQWTSEGAGMVGAYWKQRRFQLRHWVAGCLDLVAAGCLGWLSPATPAVAVDVWLLPRAGQARKPLGNLWRHGFGCQQQAPGTRLGRPAGPGTLLGKLLRGQHVEFVVRSTGKPSSNRWL